MNDKDKLVLKDGTAVELESSQGIGALNVLAENRDAAYKLWEKFTPEALRQVTVKNSDEITVGRYQDMILDHITAADQEDGTVLITFSLRNKSAVEVLTERVAAVESGQQTQDEAIGDLGQAVSDMAEGGV